MQLGGRNPRRDDERLYEPVRRTGRNSHHADAYRQLAQKYAGAESVMSAKPSHLVQILLPKETGSGQSISKEWFDGVLKKLTDTFGGATSFLRAPGQGLWQSGGGTEKDSIAVIEVMVE